MISIINALVLNGNRNYHQKSEEENITIYKYHSILSCEKSSISCILRIEDI